MKKLSEKEKIIKRKTEEIQRLQRIKGKPQTAPVKVQETVVRSSQDSHQGDPLDTFAEDKVFLENEVSRLKIESRKLRESLDHIAKENDRLKAEKKQLQQQFEALPVKDDEVETVGQLHSCIKQLNADLSTMREHSKAQSQQILRLRQQAELTEVIP